MTIILIIIGAWIAGIAWLVYEAATAPYGKEYPGIGFVYTDRDGDPK
jgi:uncharacterized membrane protein YkgB